jgi:hypothetical protein
MTILIYPLREIVPVPEITGFSLRLPTKTKNGSSLGEAAFGEAATASSGVFYERWRNSRFVPRLKLSNVEHCSHK